jgi:1,2-phenylacetyl-CoA epoxidase PaaB subunit
MLVPYRRRVFSRRVEGVSILAVEASSLFNTFAGRRDTCRSGGKYRTHNQNYERQQRMTRFCTRSTRRGDWGYNTAYSREFRMPRPLL